MLELAEGEEKIGGIGRVAFKLLKEREALGTKGSGCRNVATLTGTAGILEECKGPLDGAHVRFDVA